MGAEKAVIVKGGDHAIREEFKTAGVVTPGQLLEIDSSGNVIRHNSAGQNLYALFALQDFTQGKDIADDYASGERAQCIWARPGMIINGKLANGENVVIGDFLESDGNGDMQKHIPDVDASNVSTTAYSNQIVGIAREAVDMSGSSAVDPSSRILVQII